MTFHKDIQRYTNRTTVCTPMLLLSSSQSFIHYNQLKSMAEEEAKVPKSNKTQNRVE